MYPYNVEVHFDKGKLKWWYWVAIYNDLAMVSRAYRSAQRKVSFLKINNLIINEYNVNMTPYYFVYSFA